MVVLIMSVSDSDDTLPFFLSAMVRDFQVLFCCTYSTSNSSFGIRRDFRFLG